MTVLMTSAQSLLRLCERIDQDTAADVTSVVLHSPRTSPIRKSTGSHIGTSASRLLGVGALAAHLSGQRHLGWGLGGAAGLVAGHVAARDAVKQGTREKYGLHNMIQRYDDHRQKLKGSGASKEDLKNHYHTTMHKMAQHIHKQNGGDIKKARRSAHRAMHGSYAGTRYF